MAELKFHFLGELKVVRGTETLILPPSKKTRGLLAYLALHKRAFRREVLCELLWEIPDDPRGSLRWSLSKLRRLVDDDINTRIIADRSQVSLDTEETTIDVSALHSLAANEFENLTTDELIAAASQYSGNFLEGLELPNFHDFYNWCVAEREQVTKSQLLLLQELIHRLQPEQALDYARTMVTLAPFDEKHRATLISLLVELERKKEAEQHYQSALKMLAELGLEDNGDLYKALKNPQTDTSSKKSPVKVINNVANNSATVLLGRKVEINELSTCFTTVIENNCARLLLLRGEPGIGKSSLLQTVADIARTNDAWLLHADAFESEIIRPFALWNDAFRRSPDGEIPDFLSGDERIDRDQLFSGLSDIVAQQSSQRPVVIVFDDVQWIDESSSAALHYVVRMNSQRPLFAVIAAREAELPNNKPIMQTIHGLRSDKLLIELKVGPLDNISVQTLINSYAPDVNAEKLTIESKGNPLLAIELARAESEGDTGNSLSELIQERLSRLDSEANQVLFWSAALAPMIDIESLKKVTELSVNQLEKAIDVAEQQGILQITNQGIRFFHDLIGRSIYNNLTLSRRQSMHRRIAELLEVETALDLKLAADLAHHASKSGDSGLAARAMIFAGRLCLRFYANDDALELVRKGMSFANKLADADRVCLTLDLCEIQLDAAPLDDWQSAAENYVALAEQALDYGALPYARLGYQMASYVRWMNGQWSDAQRNSLQAERVTRGGNDKDHILGMAEAAKCLALLERDLSHADAMLMEASSLATRNNIHSAAIPTALGILRYYENQLDKAEEYLEEARTSYKLQGDRINEYQANEYLAMVDIERGDYSLAKNRCQQLLVIGEKLREGSEEPFARSMVSLCEFALNGKDNELVLALQDLRTADAKHRLAYILTRAALLNIKRGEMTSAINRATEALEYTKLLDRPSEQTLAHVVLAKAHQHQNDTKAATIHVNAIRALDKSTIANWARNVSKHYL